VLNALPANGRYSRSVAYCGTWVVVWFAGEGCLADSLTAACRSCCCSHWLPTASLSQVTLLTLSGPCNDHTLSQLPSQFPGLVSLQLLGSYYASDWCVPQLLLLISSLHACFALQCPYRLWCYSKSCDTDSSRRCLGGLLMP
jgi:hypothetical protein